MDMGGLFEFVMMVLFTGIVVAVALNFIAAMIGARAGDFRRGMATYVGSFLGCGANMAIGFALLIYAEPWTWVWLAYLIGPTISYGIARSIVSTAPPTPFHDSRR